MRIVTANQMQDWLTEGTVLEKDSHGPKVISLASGELLKIFRSRRHPFLVRLTPDAQRFYQQSCRLRERGISTPQVNDVFWVEPAKGVSACLYQPLPGTPLDSLYKQSFDAFMNLLPELAGYIHSLHQRGIYFRSLHLGNVLRTPDQGFGLIDFLDTRFKRKPLSKSMVRRNFQHLQNYLRRSKISDFPWEELMRAYEVAANQARS